ncbi:MAG: ATP-binding cassette domain-containing protein [Candidatus Peribacteria bacterium]|nr:MAG: ATP-binding cassette domain-containing protein [Candidatus Peribacteria bacterium]
MLSINQLDVQVADRQVLDKVSLEIVLGRNYCILGKNGSGKSSLALSLMGHPNYEVV